MVVWTASALSDPVHIGQMLRSACSSGYNMFLSKDMSCPSWNKSLIELQDSQLRHTCSLTCFQFHVSQSAQWSGSFVWLSIAFPQCISVSDSPAVYLPYAKLQSVHSGLSVLADMHIYIYSIFYPCYTDPAQAHSWQWYMFLSNPEHKVSTNWDVELMKQFRGTEKSHLFYTTCPFTAP